ncbi:MAG: PAS domain S-box protein [Candidatus Thorarchaeota archaeon]|nr:PAS domain S-box protein [Candidatus Thorarchaeota archaeon]
MTGSEIQNSKIDYSMLRILFDSSPQAMLVVKDGKIIFTNSALAHAVGLKPQQVVGQEISRIASLIDLDNQEDVVSRFSALSSGKRKFDKDRFQLSDEKGKKYVLEFSANAIKVDKKRFIVLYGVDVSSDEFSKKTLADERKVFSVIAEATLSSEAIPDLCNRVLKGLVDTLGFQIGTVRLFNRTTNSLDLVAHVGLEEGDTQAIVSMDDPDFLVARTARTLSPLFTENIDKSPESKDRMARAKELGIHALIFWPIIGSDGDLLGVINIAAKEPKSLEEEQRTVFSTIASMFSTILERKQAEEELQEFRDRFTAFADNMPGPVYIKDQDSKILFVNRYMRDQSPKPKRDDWEGLSNVDLFNKDRAMQLTEEDRLVLKEGPIDRIHERLLDGKQRTYRTHKFPIIREGREPLIGGFSIDITEQVEAEKQREEARARAIWMSDLMAHDINNLHQGIMSSLELLLESEEMTDNLKDIARRALEQVHRSVSLINNVKKFQLVNQETFPLEKTDPADALTASIQMVKQSFPQMKVTINTDLDSGKYCIMSNDFLQDVFYNLLHNSVKFTPDDEIRIDIKTSLVDEGEFLQFEFEDWGPGIDDRLKKSILTGIDDRVHRVSGVGLTLVKQIVEMYSGTIGVESRVEGDFTKGTRFVIKLPNGC